jgi:hypothetical protein
MKTLDFHDCVFDTLPNIFCHLQSLSLYNCTCDSLISELPYLGDLYAYDCPNISKISLVGTSDYPIYSIKISDCSSLKEVHIARKVSKLELRQCNRLVDVELSRQVGHLKMINCPNCSNIASYAPIVFQHFSSIREW